MIQNSETVLEPVGFSNGSFEVLISKRNLDKYPASYPTKMIQDDYEFDHESGNFILNCSNEALMNLAHFYKYGQWNFNPYQKGWLGSDPAIEFIEEMNLPFEYDKTNKSFEKDEVIEHFEELAYQFEEEEKYDGWTKDDYKVLAEIKRNEELELNRQMDKLANELFYGRIEQSNYEFINTNNINTLQNTQQSVHQFDPNVYIQRGLSEFYIFANKPISAENASLIRVVPIEQIPKESDEKCAICMDTLYLLDDSTHESSNKIKPVCQLPCKHLYHTDCLNNWLKVGNTCPLGKCKIVVQK